MEKNVVTMHDIFDENNFTEVDNLSEYMMLFELI